MSSSLLTFLISQKKSFNQLLQKLDKNDNCSSDDIMELTLVLGNEACDLDSQISALLWSYYKQSQTKNHKKLYIPVLNIPEKELILRKDAVDLYQQIDKSLMDNLFFIDSIPLNKILSFTSWSKDEEKKENNNDNNNNLKFNVNLMDHNNLSIVLDELLGDYVNYIIDHHRDEGKYLTNCNDKNGNRIIDIVGSNVSLLINHILSIDKNFDFTQIEKIFGSLINATILLDTGGFNEKLKKTTEIDKKVYKLFEKYNLNKDYQEWYKQLLSLRNNIDGFNFKQLLVKDLKIFKENNIIFGIPGLGTSIKTVYNKENENLFKIIHSFQTEKQLNIIPLMTIFKNNELQRELALFSDNEKLFNSVSNSLQIQQNKTFLGLECIQNKDKYQINNNNTIYYQWWKMDLSISRKKLVPLLRQILKSKL